MKKLLIIAILLFSRAALSQDLTLTNPASGLRLIVINKDYPLLKVLLPGQAATERGIEVEFPEHVTGRNMQTNNVEHLYLVTNGERNDRTLPAWKIEGNALVYETKFNGNVNMTARVVLDAEGVSCTYRLTNHSAIAYQNLQAVTCVKLYSAFSDTLLQRTYVHHTDGFDLLASETPQRITMPLNQWLPCRYLVSYTWPIAGKRVEKDADGITRYNKSRKVDKPFIATLSHDRQWVAATLTTQTGNLWTNPERSCQHADPAIDLKPGETKTLALQTFIFKGTPNQVLEKVNKALK